MPTSIMRNRDRNVEPKCIDAPRKVGLDNEQTNKNYERELKKPNPRSRRLPPRGRVPLLPVSIGHGLELN